MAVEYFYTYRVYTKGKWKGQKLIDILLRHFKQTEEYYIEALKVGAITVNNRIVNANHKLKDNELIRHLKHIHEPDPINIDKIYEDDEICVVNKPAGIACHPVGPHHFYTVTKILFGDEKVGCVNRLDLPVSGVMIINKCNKSDIHEKLENASKIYLAKVKGKFPDKATVDQPIGKKSDEDKLQAVVSTGKPSVTHFELKEYKNGYSIVICKPITGRTHQIRVHLKFLGFPIENDILYGTAEEPTIEHKYDCDADISEFKNKEIYEFVVRNCTGSHNKTFVQKDMFICLHAWKYIYNNKTFVAELPEWTKLE